VLKAWNYISFFIDSTPFKSENFKGGGYKGLKKIMGIFNENLWGISTHRNHLG
jgi:hypothetical protein